MKLSDDNNDKKKGHGVVVANGNSDKKKKKSSSTTPTSGNRSTPPSRARQRHAQRKRPKFFTQKLDHRIQVGLATIFLLYICITVGVYLVLPTISNDPKQMQYFLHMKERLKSLRGGGDNPWRKKYLENHNNRQEVEEEVNGDNNNNSPSRAKIQQLQQQFPIHVQEDDYETIIHPAYSPGLEKYRAQGAAKTLRVPKFWNPPEYGGDIRQYLGNYGERLMTREQALSVGSTIDNGNLETIYIAIATYRDPECIPTLESLYTMATHPERIRVAVIDQRKLEDAADDEPTCLEPLEPCDSNPDQVLCKYKHLIDGMVVDATLSVGPVFARHLGYRFYRGEYFAIQLDSHVRFTIGWDDDLVLQWHQANNEMAVLTTYLSRLDDSIDEVTHKAKRRGRPLMCKTGYEGKGDYKHLRHGQQPEVPAKIHGTPTLHPFWAAGFSFARGHFVIQVPYDQYLPMIFQGEEISLGLRGFTYGYDYYSPERSVCFHMYALTIYKEARQKVPHFWENSANYDNLLGTKSMTRLNAIIGMSNHPRNNNKDSQEQVEENYDHTDQDKYGLGHIRSKEKYFKLYGIHTDTQTVEDNLCQFVSGAEMQRLFIPHMRIDGMGLDFDKIDFAWVDPQKDKEGGDKKKWVSSKNNKGEKQT